MLRIVRSNFASRFAAVFPILVLTMVVSSVAYALDATAPITMENGTVALGTVGVDKGGSGQTAYSAAESVFVSTGTSAVSSLAIPSCADDNNTLQYTTGESRAFSCATPVSSVLVFTSETKLSDTDTTLFMGLGGRLSTVEADVATPIDEGKLMNIRCYASADPDSSGTEGWNVELGSGACTSAGTSASTEGLTYAGAAGVDVADVDTARTLTVDTDTADYLDVTAGHCIALKLNPHADVDTKVFLNCTIEKLD